MTHKENPLENVSHRFDTEIRRISNSSVEGINVIAQRMIDKKRKGEIALIGNATRPTVTDFVLAAVSPEPYVMYAPVISINIDKMMSAHSGLIQADLVRTLAVADQFPSNGYQRRYHEVYSDALQLQRTWLETIDSPNELPFDPRIMDQKMLLKLLLGDAKYYSDVGFADWQKAIDDYGTTVSGHPERKTLATLRPDVNHFLSVRERFIQLNFDNAMQHFGKRYTSELDEENRAEATAYVLMGISLYAKDLPFDKN